MKTNTILLIGGVAVIGATLLYLSKKKIEVVAAPVQPGQPGPDAQTNLTTQTTNVLKTPNIINTGVMPPPLVVQASRPQVQVMPLAPISSGLKPASVYPTRNLRPGSALMGAWRSNN